MARPGNIGDDFVWSPAEGCRPAGQPLQLHSACVWPMPEVQPGADAVQIQLQISAQFGAVRCTPLAALHGNTDLGARGGWGGGWVCVCGPRLFSSLLAAGRWMDAQAASDLAPATARRWPTASPPASHWCRSCSVGGMQRTGSSLPAVVIAAKSRENCCCRVQTAFDGAPKRPISFTWISFKVPPSPDAHSLTARRPEHMHGGMW